MRSLRVTYPNLIFISMVDSIPHGSPNVLAAIVDRPRSGGERRQFGGRGVKIGEVNRCCEDCSWLLLISMCYSTKEPGILFF